MRTILENDFLQVVINSKGAELCSYYNKTTQIEHLWQADASVWPWHSPVLFPVVGGCINNEILVDGERFQMKRHGFARTSEFSLLEADAGHAKFSLAFSEETLKAYPYKFTFQILYDLIGPELKISFKVINHDDKAIYFSVGAHPAFNIPFKEKEKFEDYSIVFEKIETLNTHLLNRDGFFNGSIKPIAEDNGKLPLSRELFESDALVFKNLGSRSVALKSKNHPHTLYLKYPQFSYLGIWSKSGDKFVCIEPWMGCADTDGEIVDIKDKEAIHKLDKGHVFEVDYTIGIGLSE